MKATTRSLSTLGSLEGLFGDRNPGRSRGALETRRRLAIWERLEEPALSQPEVGCPILPPRVVIPSWSYPVPPRSCHSLARNPKLKRTQRYRMGQIPGVFPLDEPSPPGCTLSPHGAITLMKPSPSLTAHRPARTIPARGGPDAAGGRTEALWLDRKPGSLAASTPSAGARWATPDTTYTSPARASSSASTSST